MLFIKYNIVKLKRPTAIWKTNNLEISMTDKNSNILFERRER